ncbi:ArsO family NAD(P)H-dependent flavin-containing monooxygenase [Chitinophaga niabensis]|uniref:Pyridine nucleotide-disulphide oxidoreductase n=1 Tax=Chitinophaga niabensis TaxID=536979 RepID=A0A1N6DY76_9BACT|nr:ArsO family NAD(P)H-dependent flavin-containing monooxygenase [Chitinophaga niabensis]SIN75715.1 Pyridine nucleotide-disulphide oxidoreductase [Chitinophaga niabensis]
MEPYDVIVIGGGQSALATGYYLRRTALRYVMLDREEAPGGAWQHAWDSLTLFSPALWCSLPGVIMPGGKEHYPGKQEAVDYLAAYEERYRLPVIRPVEVKRVSKENGLFVVHTNGDTYYAKAVVSATGSYHSPIMPDIPGREVFKGRVLHSAEYMGPSGFSGKRVAVVGEGNSGAQILAELSAVTDTLWITRNAPEFLPDHVDGKYLFDAATQLYEAKQRGEELQPPSLGHIVMVPAVKEARERNVYKTWLPPFDTFTPGGIAWKDGRKEQADIVIFCTGFKPTLSHLAPIFNGHKIATKGTRALEADGLWLVGYGSWTGFASATIIGVGRTAKRTVEEIAAFIQ